MKKKVSGQMKSLIIFLFAAILCLGARPAAAQTARVTIDLRQVKMERVMNEIEKQTRYLFIYDKSLNIDHTVSVVADNLPVTEALGQMVRGTGISYEIKGSNIILSAGELRTPPLASAAAPGEISGRVVDAHGLPVIGASVILKGTTLGVSTDVDGRFTLRIPEGTAHPVLLFDYLGYESQEVPVDGRTQFDITLQESAVAVENVVVTALGIKRQEKALSYNVQQVKAEDRSTAR